MLPTAWPPLPQGGGSVSAVLQQLLACEPVNKHDVPKVSGSQGTPAPLL